MPRQRSQHLLIRTKINRPLVGEKWVQRPRLIPRLDEALKKRVTLISAPAGFGKTALAVQWLDQSKRLSAWFSLDKNDSGPERFLRYMIAALRTVVPKFGSIIEPLLLSVKLPPTG